MKNEKILILDDNQDILDILSIYIANEGYSVNTFRDSADALNYLKDNEVDLALLDIMLPGMDGFEVCRHIREKYTFPIILITAKEESIDKINGFAIGADDYITKPFEPLEVLARVKAHLRRYKIYQPGEKKTDTIAFKGLMLNRLTQEVTIDDERLELTNTEYYLLKTLLEKQGQVVSAKDLFYAAWHEDYYVKNMNALPVHIRNIRKKLEKYVEVRDCIKTVWGKGYKIEP